MAIGHNMAITMVKSDVVLPCYGALFFSTWMCDFIPRDVTEFWFSTRITMKKTMEKHWSTIDLLTSLHYEARMIYRDDRILVVAFSDNKVTSSINDIHIERWGFKETSWVLNLSPQSQLFQRAAATLPAVFPGGDYALNIGVYTTLIWDNQKSTTSIVSQEAVWGLEFFWMIWFADRL